MNTAIQAQLDSISTRRAQLTQELETADDPAAIRRELRMLERKKATLEVAKSLGEGNLALDPSATVLVTPDATEVHRPPSKLMLVVEDAVGRREIPLERRSYSVGRHESNDIPLEDKYVSRVHARLLPVPSETAVGYTFMLEDGSAPGNASTNGTFVNGQTVRSRLLQPLDVVLFGPQVRATFVSIESPQPEAVSPQATVQPLSSQTLEPEAPAPHPVKSAAVKSAPVSPQPDEGVARSNDVTGGQAQDFASDEALIDLFDSFMGMAGEPSEDGGDRWKKHQSVP